MTTHAKWFQLALALCLVACGDDESTTADSGNGGNAGTMDPTSGSGGGGSGGDSGEGGEGGSSGQTEDAGGTGGEAGTNTSGEGGMNAGEGGVGGGGAGGTGGQAGGEPPEGLVPVFAAAGYGTRHVLSCDFGLTWPFDIAAVENGGDDGSLVRGLGYGDGKFVAAVGGGGTRILELSTDGVTWTPQTIEGHGFSDVAYGNGRFVAGGGHESLTSTDGMTWGQLGTMGEGGILRHLGFGDFDGGRFVAVGDDGRRMNSTDGVTWGHEISGGDSLNGVAFGNGVFLAISGSDYIVLSDDGGDTWTEGSVDGASGVRGVIFDGEAFLVTTDSVTHRSVDGVEWTSGGNAGPSAFAVSADGEHYAGSHDGLFMHSTDGMTWTMATSGSSQQGITRLEFGFVSPSEECPLE